MSDIWEKTLKKCDRIFSKQNWEAALFADNCTAHCIVDLKSIELVFLPLNNTCISQPSDQGIISNFKTIYRKLLVNMIFAVD